MALSPMPPYSVRNSPTLPGGDPLYLRQELYAIQDALNRIARDFPAALSVPVAFAALPSPVGYAGKEVSVSDRGYRRAYSDNTNWRFVSTDAIVS